MSNSAILNGGATLFLTTLTLVLFPKTLPELSFICVERLISKRTEA